MVDAALDAALDGAPHHRAALDGALHHAAPHHHAAAAAPLTPGGRRDTLRS
jgi:hypothetical protein